MTDIPEDFVEDVKHMLENLYDLYSLRTHLLAAQFAGTADQRADRLRRATLESIEKLNPGEDVYFRAPRARLYNLLQLHYVEELTIPEVAEELGISERQVYRDLKRGQQAIAAVFWSMTGAASISASTTEIDAITVNFREIDIAALLRYAQQATEQLATHYGLHMDYQIPNEPVLALSDPTVAQPLIVNLISLVIQNAEPPAFTIGLVQTAQTVRLEINYVPHEHGSLPEQAVRQFLSKLNWVATRQVGPEQHRLIISAGLKSARILVVDDNAGFAQLVMRYVQEYNCQIVGARTGDEGLMYAAQSEFDAIILDVMMPNSDGWSILQRLKSEPATAMIPVIVCSVFNDPELSFSLGASLFVPKPASREAILGALRQLELIGV